MSAAVEAARAVLNAHVVYGKVEEREPRQIDGNEVTTASPADLQRDWLRWYSDDYKPARAAVRAALEGLAQTLGESFPGENPFEYVPACVRLLTGEDEGR